MSRNCFLSVISDKYYRCMSPTVPKWSNFSDGKNNIYTIWKLFLYNSTCLFERKKVSFPFFSQKFFFTRFILYSWLKNKTVIRWEIMDRGSEGEGGWGIVGQRERKGEGSWVRGRGRVRDRGTEGGERWGIVGQREGKGEGSWFRGGELGLGIVGQRCRAIRHNYTVNIIPDITYTGY